MAFTSCDILWCFLFHFYSFILYATFFLIWSDAGWDKLNWFCLPFVTSTGWRVSGRGVDCLFSRGPRGEGDRNENRTTRPTDWKLEGQGEKEKQKNQVWLALYWLFAFNDLFWNCEKKMPKFRSESEMWARRGGRKVKCKEAICRQLDSLWLGTV